MNRNEFIKYCARYRVSYRDIGKMVGLSKTRIADLVNESKENYCRICRIQTDKPYCISCKTWVKKYTNLTK